METSPIAVCWARHTQHLLSLRERACPERSEGAGERGSNQETGHNEPFYANHLKWLFMDSGLLWSAPAKRRGRIEPQPRGDTSGVCRESGHLGSTRAAATALSPGRNTCAGNGYIAKSKAAAELCHLAAPPLMPSAIGSGKHRGQVAAACLGADRHSKTSDGTLLLSLAVRNP